MDFSPEILALILAAASGSIIIGVMGGFCAGIIRTVVLTPILFQAADAGCCRYTCSNVA